MNTDGTLIEARTHGVENRQGQVGIVPIKRGGYDGTAIGSVHNATTSLPPLRDHLQRFIGVSGTGNTTQQLIVQELRSGGACDVVFGSFGSEGLGSGRNEEGEGFEGGDFGNGDVRRGAREAREPWRSQVQSHLFPCLSLSETRSFQSWDELE